MGLFLGEKAQRWFLIAWDVDAWYAMLMAFVLGLFFSSASSRWSRHSDIVEMRRFIRVSMIALGVAGGIFVRLGYFSLIALSGGSPLIFPTHWLVAPLGLLAIISFLASGRFKAFLASRSVSGTLCGTGELWLGLVGVFGLLLYFGIVRAGYVFVDETAQRWLPVTGSMRDMVFFIGVSTVVALSVRFLRSHRLQQD